MQIQNKRSEEIAKRRNVPLDDDIDDEEDDRALEVRFDSFFYSHKLVNAIATANTEQV